MVHLRRAGVTLGAIVLMAVGPLSAGTGVGFATTPRAAEVRLAAIGHPRSHRLDLVPAPSPAPRRIVRQVEIAPRDTLGSLLADAGLDAADVARWSAAGATVHDPRRMRVGRTVTIEHDDAGALALLRYEIDDTVALVLERVGDELTARRETKPLEVEMRGIAGTVERGLWRDAVAAGVPTSVASALTNIFGGKVDFRRVAPGDEFRVLYEVKIEPDSGAEFGGAVLGAQLRTGGRLVTGIRFRNEAGRAAYYAPDGDGLGSGMVRYPLAYTRISSGFSYRRRHPILGYHRPHHGVDFAAPRGTPVRATADGTVLVAGWKGGMGRKVRLRHSGGLETLYGHLDRVASGVRPGARVQQGQVIGYVGATGLATGNHLHYGVRRDGRWVNPLTIGTVQVVRVAETEWPAFSATRDVVTLQLATLGTTPGPIVVSQASSSRTEG